MARYVRTVIVVDAVQLTSDTIDAVVALAGEERVVARGPEPQLAIRQPGVSDLLVNNNDYLVRYEDGRLAAISDVSFEANFAPVEKPEDAVPDAE